MAVLFSFSRFLGHKVDQGLGGLQKQDNHPGQSLTTDWGLGVHCTLYNVYKSCQLTFTFRGPSKLEKLPLTKSDEFV